MRGKNVIRDASHASASSTRDLAKPSAMPATRSFASAIVSSKCRHSAKTWRLVAQPRRAVPGEVVTLNLAPIGPPPENGPERAVATLTAADGTQQVVTLTAVPGGAGFTARLPAPAIGTWRLAAIDGPNPREIEESELEVFPPASEVRDPRADRPALDALARGTGGRVFTDAKALVLASGGVDLHSMF